MGRKLTPEEAAALGLEAPAKPRDPRDVANDAKLAAMGGPGSIDYTGPSQGERSRKSWDTGINNALGAIGSTITDTLLLGAPGKILDLLPEKAAHYLGGTRKERDAWRASSPAGELIGRTAGLGMDAHSGVGKLIGMGAEATLPVAKTAIGTLARSTVSGGGQGAASGFATPEEMTLPERGRATLQGAAVGAGVGLGLPLIGMAGKAVLDSQGGKARQLIEKRGGSVSPLTSGKGGVFDDELAGLEPNDRGIGEAGRRAAGRVLGDMEQKFYDETANPHHAAREAIEASVDGDVLRDVTPIHAQLVSLYKSMRPTQSERTVVKGLIDRIEEQVKSRGSPLLTEVELNDFRGQLSDVSGRGSPAEPTVAKAKLDKVTGAAKTMVDAGPYAEPNAKYAAGRRKLERQRNILDLPDHPSTSLDPLRAAPEGGREPEVAKVANFLARDEQNTVTAGVRNADRVNRFVEENPQYAGDIELPEVMRAKADLEFTANGKNHGGLVGRLPPGLGLGGAMALAATGQGKMAALPIAAEFAARNWPAIMGRFAYRPGMEAHGLGQMPTALPGFIPEIEQVIAEWQARQRRQQR